MRVEIPADGAFQFTGLMPGRYAVRASVGPDGGDWTLARATVRGTDVLDLPIDLTAGMELSDVLLTLSDRVSELSGTATDPSGRPLVEIALHVVPADARYHWPGSRRLREVVTGRDGRYMVRGLPPGEYLIGAAPIPTLGAALLLAPGDLAVSARVTLAAGERKVQDVRIAR
jgi:protocatechuate 3,4-dioxygenase beta subunit